MRGGKGDLFGKRSPFPPDPPTLPKTFIQAGMAGPRLADTGHGIVRCRRARLWGQAGILAAVRPGRNGPSVGEGAWKGSRDRRSCRKTMQGHRWLSFCPGYVSEEGRCQSPSLFSMNLSPKNKKACVPAGTQAVKARLGKEGGEFEGGREPPLCASQRGSLPPSTKSLLQSLTRYRGAQAGRPATRSASAGRKGRSRAWAGVTQRSSWRSRAQGVPSKAVTWKKCSCTCRSRSA